MPEQKYLIKGEADEERNDVGRLEGHGPTSSSTVPQLKPAVNRCKTELCTKQVCSVSWL